MSDGIVDKLSPEGKWAWKDLMGGLEMALELERLRAVLSQASADAAEAHARAERLQAELEALTQIYARFRSTILAALREYWRGRNNQDNTDPLDHALLGGKLACQLCSILGVDPGDLGKG